MTDDEVRQAFVRLSFRLSRHLTDHYAGELAALDDTAAVLRTLVKDDVLGRVIKRFEIENPTLEVGPAPEKREQTQLSMGSVEVHRQWEGERIARSVQVGYDIWRVRNCLVGRHPKHGLRAYTWLDLIGAYANTWGSHFSHTMPQVIDEASINGVGGTSLVAYLIESAAASTERVVAAVAASIHLPEAAAPARPFPRTPVPLAWLHVADASGTEVDVAMLPGIAEEAPDGVYPGIDITVHGVRQQVAIIVKDGTLDGFRFYGPGSRSPWDEATRTM